jgi:hypothetical protein
MAGTRKGGEAAAATNKALYGASFYKRIGSMGGQKGRTGGFYANRELARLAGAKGGMASRRTGGKNINLLRTLAIGDALYFDETAKIVRSRYRHAAIINGIRISVMSLDNGCKLTRKA